MKTILAPIDFSDVSSQVVQEAKTLAKAFGGRVVLVHAIPPPSFITEYSPAAEHMAVEEEQDAESVLKSWHDGLKSGGVEAQAVVRNEYPVTAILEEAAEAQADYIIMGSHGRSALQDLLVGDTAHGVLRKSPCPVLIVPAAKYAQGRAGAARTAGTA